MAAFKSPLHETVRTTPTDFWSDSCAVADLSYALEHGAVGATTNPSIVLEVLTKEMEMWRPRIEETSATHPTWSEVQVAWQIIEEMAVKGAALLHPVFLREKRHKGRLSIQTNPQLYRDAAALVAQAERFHALAPNVQVKIPATRAGVEAIEEATYRGVSINATVSFTLAQAVATAQAVERGLSRREREGKEVAGIAPVCTLMLGRLEDWLQRLCERDGIIVNPAFVPYAGVAVFKKAYRVFKERRYRTRLLAAAFRHHLHWSELIGGDLILTIPPVWQRRFNASSVRVQPRIDAPVAPEIVAELSSRLPDFRRAYDEDGLTLDDFDRFGATRRTLLTFTKAYADLLAAVREVMLPSPDVR